MAEKYLQNKFEELQELFTFFTFFTIDSNFIYEDLK